MPRGTRLHVDIYFAEDGDYECRDPAKRSEVKGGQQDCLLLTYAKLRPASQPVLVGPSEATNPVNYVTMSFARHSLQRNASPPLETGRQERLLRLPGIINTSS